MIENTIAKRISSIFITFFVAISMLLPSILIPKEINAGTDSVTINVLTNPPGGFKASGKSSLSSNTSLFSVKGAKFRNGSGRVLYCLDPLTIASEGTHQTSNLLGYHGLTQYDINYMACGVDYLNKNYKADVAEALTQFFIWDYLNGKTTYKATVTPTSMSSSTYNDGMSKTKNFAASKAKTAKGTGILYTRDKAQPLVLLSVSYTGYAKLKKTTKSDKHLTDLCPEQYTLEGSEYSVYSDSGLTKHVGTLKTNANGESNTIELAQSIYYAKETKAPNGYKADPKVYTINVKSSETTVLNVSDEPLFDPLSLKIIKKIEEGADKNLSLEGAEYTVKYYKTFINEEELKTARPFRTWVFRTDKNGEVFIKSEYKVGGDELFVNEKGEPIGLRGTYTVEESKAPKGFVRTEGIISFQQFTGDTVQGGAIKVMTDVTDIEETQKINIKIQKKDAETGETKPQGYGSFAGAKFNVWLYDPLQLMDVLVGTIITNENGTGELVKLAPGLYTIEEIEAPSGYNKNLQRVKIEARVKDNNRAYFDYLEAIAEKPITVAVDKTSIDEFGAKVSVRGAVLALYNSQGMKIEEWTSDGNAHVFKGLAKGHYLIKEIRAPEGYLPLEEEYKFEVKEIEEIQNHDVFNEVIPEVNTIAKFDTGVKESLPKEEVTVFDKFEYKKILKGHKYEIRAKLVEKDNADNVIAEENKKFTPNDYSGEETLKLTFNSKDLEDKRLVVLTELHRLDRRGNTLVAAHKDVNNIDETVVFPTIKTKAADNADGKKDMLAGEKQTIVDRVSYNNLITGTKYRVSGKLMDKQTGKPVLVDGKEITANKEFIAKTKEGYIDLEFTFNSMALSGKTIVIFEDLYNDKIKVATHSEITDIDQSIYIPKIGTKLTEKNTGKKHVQPLENIKLKDEVGYKNFIEGEKYFVKGKIINKKNGNVIAESKREFVAERESGTVDLEFDLNAEKLDGVNLVCFEEVYRLDDKGKISKLVAEHKDLNDDMQSVSIMKKEITKTGDRAKIVLYILGLAIASIAVIAINLGRIKNFR